MPVTHAHVSAITDDPTKDVSSGEWNADHTIKGDLPSTLSGLVLWVKADQYSGADGDLVSTWADQSGSANDLIASGTARPTYKTGILNGLPIMRFNGSSNGMRRSSVTLTEFHIWIVAKVTTMGMLYEHSDNASSNDGSYIYNTADTYVVRRGGTLVNAQLTSGWNNSRPTFDIIEHRFTQCVQQLFRNGVVITGSLAPLSIASTAQPFNLGARANAASLFTAADIAEAIVTTAPPNADKQLSIRKYLSDKYAL